VAPADTLARAQILTPSLKPARVNGARPDECSSRVTVGRFASRFTRLSQPLRQVDTVALVAHSVFVKRHRQRTAKVSAEPGTFCPLLPTPILG
jgi:hypothetical protein